MAEGSLALDGAYIEPSVARADEAARVRERFKNLVSRYYAFVWRSLGHLGVASADLDDAAQQVFLVASKKLAEIEPDRERSFLYGTAVRIAFRSRRTRERRREVPVQDHVDDADPGPGPDEIVGRVEARKMLLSILDAMDLDCRTVLVLFEIEQLTAPEIAAALEIPVGTVASRLRRAREEFRSQVRRREMQLKNRGGRP